MFNGASNAQDKKKGNLNRNGIFSPNKRTVSWAKHYKQGCSLTVWLSNQLEMGRRAFEMVYGGAFPTPEPCTPLGIGMDYPVGACVEHLYVGGPWIGGIVDGVRRVSESAGHWESDFIPASKDSNHDRIWRTSTLDTLYDLNFYPPQAAEANGQQEVF